MAAKPDADASADHSYQLIVKQLLLTPLTPRAGSRNRLSGPGPLQLPHLRERSSLGNLGPAVSLYVNAKINAATGGTTFGLYAVIGMYLLSALLVLVTVKAVVNQKKSARAGDRGRKLNMRRQTRSMRSNADDLKARVFGGPIEPLHPRRYLGGLPMLAGAKGSNVSRHQQGRGSANHSGGGLRHCRRSLRCPSRSPGGLSRRRTLRLNRSVSRIGRRPRKDVR
jgi:hypothetical protein